MSLGYKQIGDYQIPNLTFNETNYNIGKYGLLMLRLLKENNKSFYTILLMKGTLNEYLYNFNNEISEKVNTLVSKIIKQENITEDLKNTNPLLWVGKMNSIKLQAEEIVLADYIN